MIGLLLGCNGGFAQGHGPAGRGQVNTSAAQQRSAASPQAPVALSGEDLGRWLGDFMPYALKNGEIAGAVVVVVKDGRVIFQQGYGYADVAHHRPVDAETTLFRPGSISKTFTWTAVMQLVEQGKIDLDKDVNTYLDFHIPDYHGKPITMRNLMTHSPGFEQSYRDLYSVPSIGVPDLHTVMTEQIPTRIYPPGEIPAYSNYGASLAGYIVQRVSGESFDQYVAKHIFAPLGMQHATFVQPLPPNLAPLMSNGYDLADGKPKPYELIGPYPAGSLAATGADMGHWMIAHLENGQFEGHQILRPETARVMHETAFTPINPILSNGVLGFVQHVINGHRTIEHNGNSQWFHSDMTLFLDDHVGIFMSLNSRGKSYAALPIEHYILSTFADRYFARRPAPPRHLVDQAIARADARKMVGNYNGSETALSTIFSLRNLTAQVRVKADDQGHIIVEEPGGRDRTIYEEIGRYVWAEVGGDGLLAAKVKDGRVLLWSTGGNASMLPIPFYRDADWLLPLLYASIAALLVLGALWPIFALVRRYYGVPRSAGDIEVRSYRLVRIGGIASGLLMLGWFQLLAYMNVAKPWESYMVPRLLAVHLLSILVFPVATGLAIWNCWVVWSRPSGRGRIAERTLSVVFVIATFTLMWVGIQFGLINTRAAF